MLDRMKCIATVPSSIGSWVMAVSPLVLPAFTVDPSVSIAWIVYMAVAGLQPLLELQPQWKHQRLLWGPFFGVPLGVPARFAAAGTISLGSGLAFLLTTRRLTFRVV